MVDVEEIKLLVERFERNLDAYRSGKYKEEQLRLEFINPFFQTLGWDVDNEQGYAEAYKEVIHEDSIRIGGATKAPDYCFRIGGTRKFFVEAKKPSVDIKENIHPAYQLRRYAWSAKLPLSILTDFEEFAVYDCRIKPAKTDKASVARILYIEYSDYLKRWDEIASIFSKDAVLKGSFDKYVESTKLKRGTAEVDDAFLAEIEQWRDELARNIALRNPKLSTRQLNFAVQKTIDRIIFLRICEDRGIEGYGQLQALLNGANIYKRLTQLFRDADDRYNSGLFHFKKEKSREEPPDDLTLNLTIDNDKLKRIIKDIYYPDSPYEFSVLPADILGQVYEQFLGKVIRLTKAHYAKVEEKPEVRKAGGVYYTPTYIVDYIVSNTVGKLCKGKTPKGVAKLRILDPACGSGSFLLGAYQYLLDWHRDYYIEDGPEKHRKKLYQVTEREWRLSTEERKRILTNNIYGVDIDLQAVEVTKLSLLLKVLEGESEETLKRQLAIFHQRALPDLGSNIKCGNSLIGSDFYVNRQTGMFDDEEQYRINAFDWETEFPEIIRGEPRNLWFVTFVTHNSRISQRLLDKGLKPLVSSKEPLIFSPDEQILIAEKIAGACRKFNVPVTAWNVLSDHVHMIIAADTEKDLNELVRKIKGYSSREFQKAKGWEKGNQVWAQKFNRKPVKDDNALHDVLYYVQNNHLKHGDKGLKPLVSPREKIKPILNSITISVEKACLASGGFDAVIGNPPYVRQEQLSEHKDYFAKHYKVYAGTADLYAYFIERGISLLCEGGIFGIIVANKWFRANYGKPLRRWLKTLRIEELIDFGDLPVFERATTYPCILRVSKAQALKKFEVTKIDTLDFQNLSEYVRQHAYKVKQSALSDEGWSLADSKTEGLIAKLKASGIPLSEYVGDKIYYGIKTGLNEAFVIDRETRNRLIAEDSRSKDLIRPFLAGRDLKRYAIQDQGRFLIVIPNGWTRQESKNAKDAWGWFKANYPVVAKHLSPFEEAAKKRWDKGEFWWELRACEYYEEFEKPKIIYPNICKRPEFSLDEEGLYTNQKCFIIPLDDKYLLGLLNSSVTFFLFRSVLPKLRGDFYEPSYVYFKYFPIRTIDFDNPEDKARHDRMVELVERMLDLNKKLAQAKVPDTKKRLQRRIAATNTEIDKLVYELYELTEEEIRIVESSI